MSQKDLSADAFWATLRDLAHSGAAQRPIDLHVVVAKEASEQELHADAMQMLPVLPKLRTLSICRTHSASALASYRQTRPDVPARPLCPILELKVDGLAVDPTSNWDAAGVSANTAGLAPIVTSTLRSLVFGSAHGITAGWLIEWGMPTESLTRFALLAHHIHSADLHALGRCDNLRALGMRASK